MPFPVDNKERHVIPRWRDSRTTAALGELDSTSVIPKTAGATAEDSLVAQKVAEWSGHRSVSFAGDLLATALSSGTRHSAADDAANFLLESRSAPAAAKVVAKRYLGLALPTADLLELYPDQLGALPPRERHKRIHRLRVQLADSPRNVLLRADLALEYTGIGRTDKALQMMDVALRGSPNNRFLLRAAARLLVHMEDAQAALEILRQSAATKHDPWLMAAEIAISGWARKGPQMAKVGAQAVSSGRLTAFHTTELASALGTLEAESGARKKAKRLFRQSVIAPTENSVAQATWAAQHIDFDEFKPEWLELPGSFEARALESRHSGNIEAAVKDSWKWLGDQFFSPAAAVYGSYLASVGLDDHEQALRFVETGRMANKDEWLLLNNLAFSLASLNRLDEAQDILDSLPRQADSAADAATVVATRGLILFRQGLAADGRELYQSAIEAFDRLGQQMAVAVAKIFRAREEILADTDEAAVSVKEAQDASKNLSYAPEVKRALERVEQALAALQQSKSGR